MSLSADIKRDGFTSAFGRFYTTNGRIERQSGASLRSMFLPKLTLDGKRALQDHRGFVRGQLQHYGVAFDERQLTGNGTQLLKKVLQEGKCDTVPTHILELETQMHREWLDNTPDKVLDSQLIIEKYFGSARQPDRTITSTVIEIPFPPDSEFRVSNIQEAAGKINGLHQETATGPHARSVYLGWDEAAVKQAAKGHVAKGKAAREKEKQELQAAKQQRETERTNLHADYCRQAPKVASPIGSYIVDCEEIEAQWPDKAEGLCFDIDATGEPGVFIAEFDFGAFEGVMIISADKAALERYCYEEDEPSEDEGDWDEESSEDKGPTVGSKRKAPAPRRGGTSKKSKAPVRKYFLKARGRETGEGEIIEFADDGTITFKDGKFTSFVGKADMSMVGEGVVFTARKVSDAPGSQGKEWADYSARQYERERVGRWH